MTNLKIFKDNLHFELPSNYTDGDIEFSASNERSKLLVEELKKHKNDLPDLDGDSLPVSVSLTEFDLLPLGIDSSTYVEEARSKTFRHDENVKYITFDTVFKYAILEKKELIGGLAGEILISGESVSDNNSYELNIVLVIDAVQLIPSKQNTGRGACISECLMFLLHQHIKRLYLSEDIYRIKSITDVNLTLTAVPKSVSGKKWLERLSDNIETKQGRLASDIGFKSFNFRLCIENRVSPYSLSM